MYFCCFKRVSSPIFCVDSLGKAEKIVTKSHLPRFFVIWPSGHGEPTDHWVLRESLARITANQRVGVPSFWATADASAGVVRVRGKVLGAPGTNSSPAQV